MQTICVTVSVSRLLTVSVTVSVSGLLTVSVNRLLAFNVSNDC